MQVLLDKMIQTNYILKRGQISHSNCAIPLPLCRTSVSGINELNYSEYCALLVGSPSETKHLQSSTQSMILNYVQVARKDDKLEILQPQLIDIQVFKFKFECTQLSCVYTLSTPNQDLFVGLGQQDDILVWIKPHLLLSTLGTIVIADSTRRRPSSLEEAMFS